MLAVSTQTKGRNLEPYNEFFVDGITVLVSNDVLMIGDELVVSMKRKFPKKLQAHVNHTAGCPLSPNA